MNNFDQFASLPVSMQIILGIFIAVQLMLIVISLFVLTRLPHEPIAGLPKIAWLIIILMGQCIGPVVFLVLAHRDRQARTEQAHLTKTHIQQTRGDIETTVADLYKN